MVNDLDYEGIKFPVSKEDYSKIEQENNICINIFRYQNGLIYSVHVSDKELKNCMDLLLIADEKNQRF